jgi:gas vesicle protein
MFSRVRTAIRFFFVGLAVGVLLAPRSGEETRRLLRERADSLLNDVLDAASLGASGGGSSKPVADSVKSGDPEEGGEVTKATRSNGGRSRTTSSSTTAASEAGV